MAKTKAKAVDPLSGCGASAAIFQDENGVAWSFMLNYTNISFGTYGNNKFYMVQLIEEAGKYKVFRKWGRVGAKTPQRAVEQYAGSLEKAKESFQKKFLDKSGNEWPLTGPFERVEGKYVLVELNDEESSASEGEDVEDEDDSQNQVPSELDEQVQEVLKLICDADLIARDVAKMNMDLKRMPLGRLSKEQISRGYSLLQELSTALQQMDELAKLANAEHASKDQKEENTAGKRLSARPRRSARSGPSATKISKLKASLKALSSDFYTLIPHDFGRSLPPPIDSMAEVKRKIDLLEVLSNVDISKKLEQEKKRNRRANEQERVNPLDAQFKLLNVEMEPLPTSTKEYELIERYVKTTHAPTHIQYKLKLHSVLKLSRPSEEEFRDEFESIGNHMLLWHGSRLSNVVGILSKGLRIAPPEAPNNGYMFGKGIYFADSVSKSANYCWPTPENPRGVLLLVEVALGKSYRAQEAEDLSYETLKATYGCDSTHGVGRMASPSEEHESTPDGVVVPIGELEPSDGSGSLLYNEFIVYRSSQVRLRYAVTLDFAFEP